MKKELYYRIVVEQVDGSLTVMGMYRYASDMKILFNRFYSHIGKMERYLESTQEWIEHNED